MNYPDFSMIFLAAVNSNGISLIISIKFAKIATNFERYHHIRFENGGHFVSEETMNNVYGEDIFIYDHIDSNRGFIILNGESYPVYTILNNKTLSSVELNQYMLYNLNEIISYF